ncbi:MAG: hypothetical protein OXQ29_26460 [Rhodospirillaceae bacterium]|nr:hypothetical protein [Rhodospirillaceae bacterium]
MDNAPLVVLLGMLPITVALFILYVSLPVARYRRTVYRKLVRSLNETFTVPEGVVKDRYLELLRTNQDFSTKHHEIATWVGEISSQHTNPGSLRKEVGNWFSGAHNPKDLPLYYRWFRHDFDKWTVSLLTCLLPIMAVWYITTDFCPWKIQLATYVLVSGQFAVGLNAVGGVIMSWLCQKNCRQLVRNLDNILQGDQSSKLVVQFVTESRRDE